jgi:hypothetical protein
LYAILITSHKLRYYFDTYPIEVVTEFPLGDILRKKDAKGASSSVHWSLAYTRWNFEAARLSSQRHWSTSLLNGQI